MSDVFLKQQDLILVVNKKWNDIFAGFNRLLATNKSELMWPTRASLGWFPDGSVGGGGQDDPRNALGGALFGPIRA